MSFFFGSIPLYFPRKLPLWNFRCSPPERHQNCFFKPYSIFHRRVSPSLLYGCPPPPRSGTLCERSLDKTSDGFVPIGKTRRSKRHLETDKKSISSYLIESKTLPSFEFFEHSTVGIVTQHRFYLATRSNKVLFIRY